MSEILQINNIRGKSEGKKVFLFWKYPFVAVIYFFVWILISPFAWLENPILAFINTFKGFSQYDWNGTMVFMGKLITCEERPWYYLPVWFGLTIPVIYLVLFVAGHVALVCFLKKEDDVWGSLIGKYKWLACCILLFWGLLVQLLFQTVEFMWDDIICILFLCHLLLLWFTG